MIKIFSTSQVKELDEYTISHEPIPSIDLVERASTRFVQEFSKRFSKQNRIVVFAGQGNNGADALTIARLLMDEAYQVETYLFNPSDSLSPDCEMNKHRLLERDRIEFTEVITDFSPPVLTEQDIVIDGLFGSGLNRPLTGGFAAVVNYINQSQAKVVAIDIPSGLFGEDNRQNDPDCIIRAELTITFTFPKLAFLLADNEKYVGEWKMTDIGLHPEIINRTQTPWYLLSEEDISGVLKHRDRFSHKGTYGHALLIAGSRGKLGASVLSAKACLRAGAGLVTVHTPRCGEVVLQTSFPEAMIQLDNHEEFFTTLPDITPYSAVGIGPGLGKRLESVKALECLLQYTKKSIVIDADALNMLASNKELLTKLPEHSLLTPHPKEFDRLAGESTNSYERLMKASDFARTYKVCLILKGSYTAICLPDGTIFFNPTGNPGMATGGSGDVLTGILLGLLSQGYSTVQTAILGVYLHGLAGDHAAWHYSEESMIAGDIVEMLGKAFRQVK